MLSLLARHARTGGLLIVLMLGVAHLALAEPQDQPSFVGDVFKRVVFDPTTYIPAPIAYAASRLDWNTSQALFQHGFLELNPRFTVSGFPYDRPISYEAGNRRILGDASRVLATSLLNNVVENILERGLLDDSPDHRRLIRTLGWIERASFAAYIAYRQSIEHFRQAQRNQQAAERNGFR